MRFERRLDTHDHRVQGAGINRTRDDNMPRLIAPSFFLGR